MDNEVLVSALDRAERALERIERALANARDTATPSSGRDEELRARVREVVQELDELIRQAAA